MSAKQWLSLTVFNDFEIMEIFTMKKRIFVCLIIVALSLSSFGGSVRTYYKKVSDVLNSSGNEYITIAELKDILENTLSEAELKRPIDKIVEELCTDNNALTIDGKGTSPAVLSLYFADEYYKFKQDPSSLAKIADTDTIEELNSIIHFSELAKIKYSHGKKFETWREYFLDCAITSLQKTRTLARYALDKGLTVSEDEVWSEEKIKEAEEIFFGSSPCCNAVSLSAIQTYLIHTELASLGWDYLCNELSKQYPAEQIKGEANMNIAYWNLGSSVEYTPFIKLVCMSE